MIKRQIIENLKQQKNNQILEAILALSETKIENEKVNSEEKNFGENNFYQSEN